MEEIIKKMENYNIFNYLLPAIIFNVCCKYYIWLEIVKSDNLLVELFIYYFIGLVLSRIGSLIIKPLLWKLKILKENDSSVCKDFYNAEKEDIKINILFTDYNMYRTFIATFLVLLVIKLMYKLKQWININSTISLTILFVLLILLFTMLYKKQLEYIHNRVKNTNIKD